MRFHNIIVVDCSGSVVFSSKSAAIRKCLVERIESLNETDYMDIVLFSCKQISIFGEVVPCTKELKSLIIKKFNEATTFFDPEGTDLSTVLKYIFNNYPIPSDALLNVQIITDGELYL